MKRVPRQSGLVHPRSRAVSHASLYVMSLNPTAARSFRNILEPPAKLAAIHDLHVVLPDPVTPVKDSARGQDLAIAPYLRSSMVLVSRSDELELEEAELMVWDVSGRVALLLEHDLTPGLEFDGKGLK
jgi:hypothetical protein